jgi:hypothetical protein
MTKGEQARLTAWRLKVLQQAVGEGNVVLHDRRSGWTAASPGKSAAPYSRSIERVHRPVLDRRPRRTERTSAPADSRVTSAPRHC